jgi:hypothetical protein
MDTVREALRLIVLLTELVKTAVDASTSENPSRVEDVIPETLRTSIAKLNAELEAAKKFGPR